MLENIMREKDCIHNSSTKYKKPKNKLKKCAGPI